MSEDAIALLHIPDPRFRRALIERYRFKSIGTDAIVVELGAPFVGFELKPARVAEVIEALIGEAIDAHDDPRGILFAPESWVPTGTSYVTAVASIERGKLGTWAAHEGASLEPQRDHDLIELVEQLGGTCDVAAGGILRAADLRNTPVTAAQLELLARGELETLAVGGTARAGGGLSRQGLAQLAKFRTLRTLRITRLALTDTDLAALVPLASLETLELERAPILGGGFERLAVLTKLSTVVLSYCKIDDDGMESVARLPALRVLDLEPANITDAGLAELATTQLRTLRAGRTRITDAGVAAIKPIKTLTELSLARTAITDAVVAHLSGLPALRVIDVRGTQLSARALAQLEALPKIERVVSGE